MGCARDVPTRIQLQPTGAKMEGFREEVGGEREDNARIALSGSPDSRNSTQPASEIDFEAPHR